MCSMQPQDICCSVLQPSLGKEVNLKIKAHSSHKKPEGKPSGSTSVLIFTRAPFRITSYNQRMACITLSHYSSQFFMTQSLYHGCSSLGKFYQESSLLATGFFLEKFLSIHSHYKFHL